ncbi:hypothetical protein HK405_000783, partial [Cladochytrium tenue]
MSKECKAPQYKKDAYKKKREAERDREREEKKSESDSDEDDDYTAFLKWKKEQKLKKKKAPGDSTDFAFSVHETTSTYKRAPKSHGWDQRSENGHKQRHWHNWRERNDTVNYSARILQERELRIQEREQVIQMREQAILVQERSIRASEQAVELRKHETTIRDRELTARMKDVEDRLQHLEATMTCTSDVTDGTTKVGAIDVSATGEIVKTNGTKIDGDNTKTSQFTDYEAKKMGELREIVKNEIEESTNNIGLDKH